MRITVAIRVIGGFMVISLLLIALGISSIRSVSNIGKASEELSNVALPTVASSSDLKASFLNMGRLTFEGFVSDDRVNVTEKQNEYASAKENFDSIIAKLVDVVKNDKNLSTSATNVQIIYDGYNQSAQGMFESHTNAIDLETSLSDIIEQLEEKTDDASSLLLDFTDLDEVANSVSLQAAADLTNDLESSLLSLLTTSSEYKNTETIQRAELRRQGVTLVLQQTNTKLSAINDAANGADTSGTIDDVSALVSEIDGLLTKPNGLLNIKLSQLHAIEKAQNLLEESDLKIAEGVTQLTLLNQLADKKALDIKSSVSDQISSSTWTVVLVIFGSLAIATGIAYVSVRAITIPLARVNELLKVASSGDLTHRLDDSSTDEFGILASNCNQLIDNLKELINTINQRADQLAAASVQTSTITLQTTASIEDQKLQISQIAAATTQMHTTAELVSANADDTLKQIKHADVEAEKVKAISAKNKSTIQVLANDVEEAAEVINKLHQDSASISGILDVIRGVADQTNLLALNAAIEAARAGEQGRGFAVVADEVRTLASRTQKSTQEINSMIEVLQAGAEKAVAVMNQGREQTVVCVEQTETAGEALNLITDAVHKAYEVSTRIEQAAREQHTVSSEISERLENIVGIAEQTTVGAQQTSDSSAEVARLAEELQESIGRFKV
ncbi:MAG: methyl-accepting chemotaxis protein [Alphaproteobacteria bacterium]|jgi:methyl-accepting chemotaxis protein